MESMKDIESMGGMRDTSLWCMRDIVGMGGMRVMGGMGGSEVRAVGRDKRF